MTKEDLLSRLQDIEWDDFEVKEAKCELPKSIWETVSAFCNTSGGWIVLGVAQQGKQFEITGVVNAEKLEQDFFGVLRSQKFNAILAPQAYKYIIDEKTVLAFFIPSSPQKPIYFNTPTNTFIRCGSGDQRATHSEISAMFREQSFGIRSELAIPETHIRLLNQDSLHSYRSYMNAYNPLVAHSDYDDETFCKKLGITDDKGVLTYAGLLMLGKSEVIHRHVPTFWIDYIEVPGNSVQEAQTRYTYRIPEQENLWEYYHAIIKRLRLFAETPFRMNEEGIAVDDNSQMNVLREALVNMLMHTDHFSSIHSCIRVYTNRLEFMNAGSFPISIERLSTSMISRPRNPTIAKLFRFVKLAENAGFGIDKMKSWKQLTGNDMAIQNEIDYVTVTFDMKGRSENIDQGGQIGGQIGGQMGGQMPKNRVEILRRIIENNYITRKELAEKVGIAPSAIQKHLEVLVNEGYIMREGKTRSSYWIILKRKE